MQAPSDAPGGQSGAHPATHARTELGAASHPATVPGANARENLQSSTQQSIASTEAGLAAQFARVTAPGQESLHALSSLFEAAAENALRAGVVSSAIPAGFPGTLGLTNINIAGFTFPTLALTTTSRTKPAKPGAKPAPGSSPAPAPAPVTEWVAKVAHTTEHDSTHPSVATPAGKHKYATVSLPVAGTPTTFDVFLEITPAFHAKIVHAEQEHLNDLLLAHNLTIKPAAAAVNSLVPREFIGPSQADAETAATTAVSGKLHKALTADPVIWRSQLAALCVMSADRDSAGWHTFAPVVTGPTVRVDVKAKTVTHGISDGTTKIGSVPSATVVHF